MYLRAMGHWRGLNSALYLSAGKVVMLATFLTWVLLKNTVKVTFKLLYCNLTPDMYISGLVIKILSWSILAVITSVVQ